MSNNARRIAAGVKYFSLSPEQKMRDRVRRDNYRAYSPLVFFNASTGGLQVKRRGTDRWCRADAPPEALTVNIGDVSREVWRTNWPDATPQGSGFDLGTLED